jgi:phosphonate transport system substrate-binding protein
MSRAVLSFASVAAAVCVLAALFLLTGGNPASTAQASGSRSAATVPGKLVVVFQKQKDPGQLLAQAEQISAYLSERINMPVETVVPSSYGATVQALVSNPAHVAYVSSLPYVLARQEAPVTMPLAEVRGGKTEYDSIFVVRADSDLQSLEDLRGKRMAFTSPTSTSGYLMAYSRLVDDGLLAPKQQPGEFFGQVTFAGGYDRALMAVANGQADVCAVSDYTMEGPKANLYLDDATRAKLRILTRTPGVPTHGICMRSDLPPNLQSQIVDALLELSAERPELLADVYGAAELRRVDGKEHVAGTLKALENTGLGVEGFVD